MAVSKEGDWERKVQKVSSGSNSPRRLDEDGQLTPGRDLPVEGDSKGEQVTKRHKCQPQVT
jgi:hypothetical protein